MHLPRGRCIRENRYAGMILIETGPVVLHVSVVQHDGKQHLAVVGVLLLLVKGGVILGIERTGVASLDLEHIGADGACQRTGKDPDGSAGNGSDELGIEGAGTHGGEGAQDHAACTSSDLKSELPCLVICPKRLIVQERSTFGTNPIKLLT